MKTRNYPSPARKCKSLLEQEVKRGKDSSGRDNVRKLRLGSTSSFISPLKCFSCKSETTIRKSSFDSEVIPPEASSLDDFQPAWPATNPNHLKEFLRKNLIKLNSCQWNESVPALKNIVQVSRVNPMLLEKVLPNLYKKLIALLKSLRWTVARTACLAANELFMNTQPVQCPEFDELVLALLQKTGDNNKCLMKDALEALNSLIIHVSPMHTIRILLHRRIAAYNLAVKTIVAKLLVCVVIILGSDSTITLNEETKNQLVFASARFLQDDSDSIKLHGILLIKMIMKQKDFESIIQRILNSSALRKVNEVMEKAMADDECKNNILNFD